MRRLPLPILLILAGGWNTHGGVLMPGVGLVNSASVQPRWGQSSFLLNSNGYPSLAVISGKAYVAGQTIDSTPSSTTSLFLDLTSPITDLSDPPWAIIPSAPIVSYSSAVTLSGTSALIFGGDAAGDPLVPIQTANDSSWLYTHTSSVPVLTHQPTGWDNQPSRRQNMFSASVTNGTLSRAWFFGGLKSDGSGIVYSELWEFTATLAQDGTLISGKWTQWIGQGGPPAMYDGTAVVMNKDGQPIIYFIGGATSTVGGTDSSVPLHTIWSFTPSDSPGSGSWSSMKTSGAPQGRRGHVAVSTSDNQIWIQGGRTSDGTTVLSDAAVLDVGNGKWTSTESGTASWGSSAIVVGDTVVMAFGYGVNTPVATDLRVYSPGNDTWLPMYYPSYADAIDNPKNGLGSASATIGAGTAAQTPGYTPDTLALPTTGNAATTTANPSTPAQWTAPGVAPSTVLTDKNVRTTTSSNESKTTSSTSPRKTATAASNNPPPPSIIAGAVVGGLGAAAAVFVVTVILARRRRRKPYQRHSDYYTGGAGGGSGSLMAEHRFGSSGTNGIEEARPAGFDNRRVKKKFLGMLNGARSGGKGNYAERFSMLDDEESEKWNSGRGRGDWVEFNEVEDGEMPVSMNGRGGMGVWNQYGQPDLHRSGTTRSFLTAALGGFTPLSGSSAQGRFPDSAVDGEKYEEDGADLGHRGALAPINEWDERSEDGDHSHTEESAGTRSTQALTFPRTMSSRTTDPALSPPNTPPPVGKGYTSVALQSPSSRSLYGSTFARQSPAFALFGTRAMPAEEGKLRRDHSWWSRISKHSSSGQDPSVQRIRDPAPAPSLDVFDSTDPFADAAAVPHSRSNKSVDEYGRSLGHGTDQTSLLSNKTTSTVASYALEEAMRHMDVVQRVQTPSEVSSVAGTAISGYSSVSNSNERLHGAFDSRNDASVVWNGPEGTPNAERIISGSGTFAAAATSMPPPVRLPLRAPTTDQTANQRHLTAGKTGVRAMVSQFERRSSSSSDLARLVSNSPMTRSSSVGNVKKVTLDFDRSSPSRTSKTRQAPILKVGHGLAKKQKLFVANPDV